MFRILLSFFIVFSLAGCGSKNAKKKINEDEKTTSAKESKQKTKQPKEEKFPTLTFETYEEFLLNWGKKNPENRIEIETEFGNIQIKLYKQTPIHRANFLMLVKRGFFNTTVFYRVIDNFVIQGGNSDTWETQELKAEIGNYKIKPEFVTELFHKRGAVAMARNYTDNPDKLSSPYTFYIVQRGKIKPEGITYLRQMEDQVIPEDQAQHYMEFGGSPSLDGEHTVIGEVISGMDVVDAIAKVETDYSDWPKSDVWMKMKVLD